MRRSPLLAAALAATLALGTAACGDDGSADTPTATTCPSDAGGLDAAREAPDTTLVDGNEAAGGLQGGNPNVANEDQPGSAGDNSGAGDAPTPGDSGSGDGDFRAPEAGASDAPTC